MFESMGITSFTQGSSLTLKTNNLGKDINMRLTATSFADTKNLYRNVKHFDVIGNGIRSISKGTFSPFQNLDDLKIHRTGVSTLPENLFSRMPLLKTVQVFQNEELQSFPNQMFDGNNSLTTLKLTHNELVHKLPKSLFLPLKNLQELNIGSNNFSVIPSDLLKHSCAKLTKLVFLHDLFKSPSGRTRNLPSKLLKSCTKLEKFLYSFHKAHTKNALYIPPNFFKFQKSTLKQIELDNANLQKNQFIDLFFNGSRVKKSFMNLTTLSLKKNAIHCKEILCKKETHYKCDCDLVLRIGQLSKIINGNNTKDSNFKMTCNNSSLYDQLHLSIVEDITNVYIPYCEQINFKTIIFCVVGLAMVLFSVLIILCAKERILISLYNHSIFSRIFWIAIKETQCVCDNHPSHTECKHGCFCRDAFISYSQEDENFATLLRDNLEDNNNSDGPENASHKQMAGRSFTCLDHQRDWRAGSPIAANIRYIRASNVAPVRYGPL